MKRFFLVLAVMAASSCSFLDVKTGNGVSADTVINVREFDSVSSQCSLNVIYNQTDGAQSVTLTCDENLIDCYDIRVDGGTLVVDVKRGVSIRTRAKSFVTVNAQDLCGINVSGSGNVNVSGSFLAEDEVNFSVSGSGAVRGDALEVACRDFSASVSGSGSIAVSSVQASSAAFKDSGSGSINVDRLTAHKVTVKLSGSGRVGLACKDAGDIVADLSGSGSLHLSGNARSLKSNTSGSGRVRSSDLVLSE